MVTPALIDINILCLKHLDKAYYYLSGQDYDSCTASLHSVNAALPPEYHIQFNTESYESETKHPIEIYCKPCGSKHKRDEIKIWDMLLPLSLQIGHSSKTIKAWTCPDCQSSNILTESKLVKRVTKEPFFIKVVPRPPERKQNLSDRTSFHIHYKAWFGMVVAELTRQISQLRWDNHTPGDRGSTEELQESILKVLEEKY